MKKIVLGLLLGMGLSGAALANDSADKKFEVYGKAGLPNIAVGGGYGINEQLTVRGDLGVMGISRDFDEGDVKYSAKFRNNKANVYADYFPMSNGFRLTGGLALGRAELKADGTAKITQNATFELGGKEYNVTIDGNDDKVSAKVKYPAVSPYLGLGWGHNIKTAKGVWGFTADLGVFIGSPKTSISLSNSLNDKLVVAEAAAGASLTDEQRAQAQAEINRHIDEEKKKIQDKVAKVKVLPMISVGASYRF
ncbi:hypothetical protein LNQ82_06935 [Conchiformibius steedae DSM 2580]|uniref:Porin family protein n=1 Tax=Conchiformibius steedae DSM 2580 TaxID=1121352 RepID=A0AAE9HUL0_9NEIS|nr:hypothetical protein [Conchiformibius steedae]QMT34174.1 hypothetical protein H3L98_04020 [Conchiformibius steedae]URD66948.1 hypothetical protein LNQ82_06935 [Conchiformibius steedae DSM 2580]